MISIIGKIKEAIFSILPIFIITLIISITLTDLESDTLISFTLGTLLMIVGMPVFLLGIDLSVSPMGEEISEVLTKSNKLYICLIGGAVFGFIVTVAEPDLHILAGQVNRVTAGSIDSSLMIILVSVGIGVMISLAVFRILKNIRLNIFMAIVYAIILILGFLTQSEFIGISFDASGSTTGSVSVPFLLALSSGISSMTRSNEVEQNDGFGMLGITSSGAIIVVMLQGVFSKVVGAGAPIGIEESSTSILRQIPPNAWESFLSLTPILVIYLLINVFVIKSGKRHIKRILIGSCYTYVGIVLFLTGVNAGFIEQSRQVGYKLAMTQSPGVLLLVGMLFGVITIPAEPSVHILTKQIEDETAGSIKSSIVMFALCAGVSIAVFLSILRILILALELWHILLPGMAIAILLSFIVPDIFVGIAYDSGGVAAGTMTAAFILPFAQGAASFFPSANVVLDSFGVIALVAMTPLITLQLLGLVYKIKTKKRYLKLQGGSEID